MRGWWHDEIVAGAKGPLLLALVAFVITFVATRGITRLIRAGKGPFHNMNSGGVHLHHSTPGVILLVAGAFLSSGAEGRTQEVVRGSVVALLVSHFLLVLVVVMKGKYPTALIGLFLTPVVWNAAVRLARPHSPWVRRFYSPARMQHATARAAELDRRWGPVREHWADFIGGSPSVPNPPAPAAPAPSSSPKQAVEWGLTTRFHPKPGHYPPTRPTTRGERRAGSRAHRARGRVGCAAG